MKAISTFLMVCLFVFCSFAQTTLEDTSAYYWYKDQKIFLIENTSKKFLLLESVESFSSLEQSFIRPECNNLNISAVQDTTVDIGCPVELSTNLLQSCYAYWWFDNSTGNLVSQNPYFTIIPTNTTTYTLKVVSPLGCIYTDEVTITVTSEDCRESERPVQSIQTAEHVSIRLHPNPANYEVSIYFDLERVELERASYYLLLSSINHSHILKITLPTDGNRVDVSLNSLPRGSYSVTLMHGHIPLDSKILLIQ